MTVYKLVEVCQHGSAGAIEHPFLGVFCQHSPQKTRDLQPGWQKPSGWNKITLKDGTFTYQFYIDPNLVRKYNLNESDGQELLFYICVAREMTDPNARNQVMKMYLQRNVGFALHLYFNICLIIFFLNHIFL